MEFQFSYYTAKLTSNMQLFFTAVLWSFPSDLKLADSFIRAHFYISKHLVSKNLLFFFFFLSILI